jgi:hypothetical protein
MGKMASAEDDPVRAEMQQNRAINGRLSRTAAAGNGSIQFATGRSHDPMFYWRQNNIPYDIYEQDVLKQIRFYCRMVYLTHPVLAAAIDIYSKYPIVGMELICKDKKLTDFYTDLFFDQLEYDEYFIDIGREYWTVGEAFPLGSFNEMLGIWEDDELLNPDTIDVIQSPFTKEPRFEMALPDSIKEIIEKREPKWEFEALMRSYPELKNYMHDDARMPVSGMLLRHLKFKADTFHPRGIPIMLRGFRAIIQEEMLNSAQDAIADRLYTPLILAKLGASASDLGTTQPWVPTQADIQAFNNALDVALAADFRVLTHHFAVDMEPVFGRESMPRFDSDFDRLMERELQVFGLSKTLLSGAGQGETYAADALNRDLVSQLLTAYQRKLKRLYRERAIIVAEAQEHYDYEVRGGKRYPIMEEVIEYDEETGEPRIVEQPKLLIPELHMRTMNLRAESEERAFVEGLVGAGVPISVRTRLVNVPIDFDDELEATKDEAVQQALAEQETRKAVYMALRNQGLPIPEDLRADFEPTAQGAEEVVDPMMGMLPAEEILPIEGEPGMVPEEPIEGEGATVIALPRNRMRPEESDEMREGMPKPAARTDAAAMTKDGEVDDRAGGLQFGPRHVGMRRHARVTKDTDLDSYQQGPAR